MSYGNPHIIRQRVINFDPVKEDPSKTGDSFYITKNINGWSVRFSVDEYGKISVIGWKDLGALGTGSEAKLNLTLDTTERRTPGIKLVSGSNFHEPKHIEVDDRKDRNTKSFEQDSEYYKRAYPASSVLTSEEFFSEQIPSFEALLKEKGFNTNVSQIAEETSKVTKPYNRSWKPSK